MVLLDSDRAISLLSIVCNLDHFAAPEKEVSNLSVILFSGCCWQATDIQPCGYCVERSIINFEAKETLHLSNKNLKYICRQISLFHCTEFRCGILPSNRMKKQMNHLEIGAKLACMRNIHSCLGRRRSNSYTFHLL